MSQTIERVQGETGNPITGILNNKDASLVIPNATPCTVSGTRTDTGERVIDAEPVTITDYTTRAFSYTAGASGWLTPCTVKLQFKLAMASGKPVIVPDLEAHALYLTITPATGS